MMEEKLKKLKIQKIVRQVLRGAKNEETPQIPQEYLEKLLVEKFSQEFAEKSPPYCGATGASAGHHRISSISSGSRPSTPGTANSGTQAEVRKKFTANFSERTRKLIEKSQNSDSKSQNSSAIRPTTLSRRSSAASTGSFSAEKRKISLERPITPTETPTEIFPGVAILDFGKTKRNQDFFRVFLKGEGLSNPRN